MKAQKVKSLQKKKKPSRGSALKTIIISGFGLTLFFGLISLIGNWGDWVKVGLYSGLGLFIGLLAAPEFEPKQFKHPIVWQAICGGVCGSIVGLNFNLHIGLSVIVGIALGATAKLWLKHFPTP